MKKKLLFLVAALALFVPSVMAAEVTDATSLKTCLTDGGTCKVTKEVDASAEDRLVITKDVNLDLNGNTLKALLEVQGSTLTITSSTTGGKLVGNSPSGKSAIAVDGGKLVLESGTISNENAYGVYCKNGATAIVNGGEITSKSSALAGNNTTGVMHFEVNGGTLTAGRGMSIYMPNQVSLKVTDGTLNGGISVRMGTITISGGTINAAKGSYVDGTLDEMKKEYASDNIWLPDAFAVLGGSYPNTEDGNDLNVTITGGTFNVDNKLGSAIVVYDLGVVEQKMNVTIKGGTFVTNSTDREVYNAFAFKDLGVTEPKKGYGEKTNVVTTTITGGTFSTDVAEYLPNIYVSEKEGTNYVVKENKVLVTEDKNVTFESEKAIDSTNTLKVTENKDKKVSETAAGVYKENTKVKDTEVIVVYDINVVNANGGVVEMKNGKYTITVTLPSNKLGFEVYKVIYIGEDGKTETLAAEVVDGKLVFTTTHLSTYAVVGYNNVEDKKNEVEEETPKTDATEETKKEENPETGDLNLVLIALVISLGTVGVAVTSKKISAKVTR